MRRRKMVLCIAALGLALALLVVVVLAGRPTKETLTAPTISESTLAV